MSAPHGRRASFMTETGGEMKIDLPFKGFDLAQAKALTSECRIDGCRARRGRA
jgi:hypothetical protein